MDKLNTARQSVRPEYQDAAKKKLEDTFGDRYSLIRMMDGRKQVERMAGENKPSKRHACERPMCKKNKMTSAFDH